MRTTLNIDDALLERAEQLTGISEKTALMVLVDTSVWVDHLVRDRTHPLHGSLLQEAGEQINSLLTRQKYRLD